MDLNDRGLAAPKSEVIVAYPARIWTIESAAGLDYLSIGTGHVNVVRKSPPPEKVVHHPARARDLLQMKTVDKLVGTSP